MPVVTRRYVVNGIVVVVTTLVLIVVLIGLSARVTLKDLLIAALMAIAIGGAVAGLMGLLFLKIIYPSLGISGDQARPIANSQVLARDVNLEYKLNADDVLAFQLYHYEHSPQLGRARKLLRRVLFLADAVVLLAAVILVAALGRERLLMAMGLGVWVALMFLWAVLYPSLLRRSLRRAIARNFGKGRDNLIGRHEISITPRGLTDTADVGQSAARWSAVEYVAFTDQHLFVLVRGAGLHIVPRRAFVDEAAFRQFAETARAFHRAASAQSAELPESTA